MPIDLDANLQTLSPSDYSAKLVNGICGVVPFAPTPDPFWSLVEGVQRQDKQADKPVLEAAKDLAEDKHIQRALWMVDAIDKADTGISAFSGVASAVKLYQAKDNSERLDALETDPQQAADAVVKALALAFIIHHLYEGSITEKISQFRESNAGQQLLFYFATIEVGLPFMDNALVGGGTLISELWDRYGPEQTQQLAALTGEEEAQAAANTFQQLLGPIQSMAKLAAGHLQTIGNAAVSYLPSAMAVGDKMAGAAATGADLLPVYRYLGTQLVAEEVVRRAVQSAKAEKKELVSSNPANVEVKYTRSDKDLPDTPKPVAKSGCLGCGVWLLAAGLGLGAATAALAFGG